MHLIPEKSVTSGTLCFHSDRCAFLLAHSCVLLYFCRALKGQGKHSRPFISGFQKTGLENYHCTVELGKGGQLSNWEYSGNLNYLSCLYLVHWSFMLPFLSWKKSMFNHPKAGEYLICAVSSWKVTLCSAAFNIRFVTGSLLQKVCSINGHKNWFISWEMKEAKYKFGSQLIKMELCKIFLWLSRHC